MTRLRAFVVVAILGMLAPAALAQRGTSEAQLRLELQRAEVKDRVSQAALDQKKAMYQEGLVSKAELMNAEADVELSKIETARARLVLANELPSFRIVSAVKSAGAMGQTRVRLTIQELHSALDYDDRRSYLISLLGQNTIIGVPYQQQVAISGPARTTSLDFHLLRDTDDLTVLVVSGARREEIPIVLQRSGVGKLLMSASNFSQTGVFGEKVDYAIQLQRFSPDIDTVELHIVGLPFGFTFEWVDRDTGAKLSSIRFAENQNTLRLTLRVFLPSRVEASESSQLLAFRVEARAASGTALFGTVDLQLQTTGAPQLALIADNLLLEIAGDEPKRMTVSIENTGPVEARDVILSAELPAGLAWQVSVPAIAALAPNQRKSVDIVLSATEDAVPGEYTVKLNAHTQSRMAQIESPDVSLRVMIRSSSLRSSAVALLLLFLAALVGAVVWGARKVRHR